MKKTVVQKFIWILIISLSSCLNTMSQQYIGTLDKDSLQKILLTAKDTQRINTLNLLSRRLLFDDGNWSNMDSLARQALALSKALNYGRGTGNALLTQALVRNHNEEDYSITLNILQTALPLLKRGKDSFFIANCFEIIADCYHFLGKNNNAITYFDSSIHLFQQLGDTLSSLWTTVSKGHSFYDLGNYTSSYKTFQQALELTPKTDTFLQSFAYIQTATLFNGASMPEMAIEYVNRIRSFFPNDRYGDQKQLPWVLPWGLRLAGEAYLKLKQTDSAFKIATQLNIPFKEQDSDDNLFYGRLYSAMGEYEKALIHFRQGYQLSQHASHKIALARQANELARVYFNLKDFKQSIFYANDALKIGVQIHALLEQKNAAGVLGDVYAAAKNYPKAYYYNQLYKSLNDSLAPEEYKRKLALVQVKDQLEMQKKEARLLTTQNQVSQQQIKLQESSLKRQSLLLYIFIAALLIMVLLAILVNRNIKLKRRKAQLQQLMEEVNAQQKLSELEKEKSDLEMQALRAQMNPHFIFNCLSSINRFILINKIDEASDYLTKFSRLIRMALHNSEKALITLDSELESLRLYLDLERLRFKNAFNYTISLVNDIDINAVYIPPMLIQPFAENAIWHGLMHKKGVGQLDIQFCAKGKALTCTITDDGIGRQMAAKLNSRSAEKNKSMGVDITARRLNLLNKSKNESVIFNIEDRLDDQGDSIGTRVMLTIPFKDLTETFA